MSGKGRFSLDEALTFVLEPGSDSELSDLADSDDEVLPEVEEMVTEQDEGIEQELDYQVDTEVEVDKQEQNGEYRDTEEERGSKKRGARVYRWRKKEPIMYDTAFKGNEFNPLPDSAATMTPLQYFKEFWDDNVSQHLAHHTNLYSVQESGKAIETNQIEIETFFGIQMTMAIVKMAQYKMYWSPEFRCDRVTSAMTLKRYITLRRFLHANDNTKKNDPKNINDKLFKVRPLLELVRNNCIKIEPEQCHSIDEQIIPAKTKRSGGVKQYNPKKIHKWGFKNMVRAGQSGIVYDFFMYGGKHSAGAEKCGAEESVIRLVDEIPRDQNYQVFFDNWFSTLPLIIRLHAMGILATATFRANRIGGCPFISDKDLKSNGRGSFDFRIDLNSPVRMIKWFDNKAVILGSTFSSVKSSSNKQRWDAKKKEHCSVTYPDMVKDYNESMGGVDLNDMLISLYRVDIKTRKRWYLKIITHLINLCNVNGWLLYGRYSNQLGIAKKTQLSLLQFTKDVADGLLLVGKNPNKPLGRPLKRRSLSPVSTIGKKPMVPKPVADVRYDGLHHWPDFRDKRNRCRVCSMLSFVVCSKCKIHLCFQKERNCFQDFHN